VVEVDGSALAACHAPGRSLVVILGVDPGSSAVPGDGAGIAWLSEDEEGCFTVTRAPHESLAGYCARLRDQIEALLPRWAEGSMVVIEAPFSSPQYPQVGLRLSRVVGVVAEIAERLGATVVEVPPTKLRAAHAIKAKGKAGKVEMENAMKARGHRPANEHEADAWACVEHALRHTVPA